MFDATDKPLMCLTRDDQIPVRRDRVDLNLATLICSFWEVADSDKGLFVVFGVIVDQCAPMVDLLFDSPSCTFVSGCFALTKPPQLS